MADVATLIERIESLRDTGCLPDDGEVGRFATNKGYWRRNLAVCRVMSSSMTAHHSDVRPIDPRLACELVDNVETILSALRYWRERKRGAKPPFQDDPHHLAPHARSVPERYDGVSISECRAFAPLRREGGAVDIHDKRNGQDGLMRK